MKEIASTVYKQGKYIYKAKGTSVIVEMEEIDNKIGTSGLIMPDNTTEDFQIGHPYGYVRAIGSYAWNDEFEPRAKIGERVTFKRYAGTTITRLKAGNVNKQEPELRIMRDFEISCVVELASENK